MISFDSALTANEYVINVRYDIQHNEAVSSKHWT
jgi:hypothetical protein